jgi:hypothetical protein
MRWKAPMAALCVRFLWPPFGEQEANIIRQAETYIRAQVAAWVQALPANADPRRTLDSKPAPTLTCPGSPKPTRMPLPAAWMR